MHGLEIMDIEEEKVIKDFCEKLESSQVDLDPKFYEWISENFWELI